MPDTIRWRTAAPPRYLAGISRGRQSGRLKAALLRCNGQGWGLHVDSTEAVTLPPIDSTPAIAAEVITQAIVTVAGQADIPVAEIESVGIDDLTADAVATAAEVAERTGITVISRFADRDRVVGGRGWPLSPAADWVLFRSTRISRILVSLGQTLRVTILLAGQSAADSLCFDAGPGNEFLDALASRLSQGKYPFDPSGHFAVQGRLSEDLLCQWQSHPFLLRPVPRFIDRGIFDETFLEASLSFAREGRLSGKDVLCTANHFLSWCLREVLERHTPSAGDNTEVILSGGGIRNGLLHKLVADVLKEWRALTSDELGVPGDVLEAGRCAILAAMTMDNVPANIPSATGASSPRVLGVITSGAQNNWDRWVCHLADRFDEQAARAA